MNSLLPKTQFYLTYEGSVSEPPCSETANWIVLNKPVYILERSLFSLRNSIVIDGYGDNFRPIQALNNRCITTNIASNLNGNNANSSNPTTGENNASSKRTKAEQKLTVDETISLNQLANQTSAQDELSGLKKFCTTNNVYGYYTYKGKLIFSRDFLLARQQEFINSLRLVSLQIILQSRLENFLMLTVLLI